MIETSLRVLEYDKITALLAGFTTTEPGRELVLKLAPLADGEAVAESLAEVSEMA